MKSFLFALSCSALAFAAPPCSAEEPSPGAKTVQLSKVILDTESRPVAGKLKGGTLCVFPSKIEAILPKQKKSEDYERYDQLFAEKMSALGFHVVTVSANLFADDSDKNKADLLIGAVVHPDTLNVCSSVNGEKGDVTLSIDWQIYDRATHTVVATLTTSGHGIQEKFSRVGLTGMWNRAFTEALNGLVEQGALQKYTGPVAPPSANGS
ncbi:hypothetical protein GCM10009087_02990 [Sphingomonas oligophenolica]|uniref:ABC transporter substrate-binding protein n=1 Tax=Sphingomonas oligophenolica TaxID=301154 RepID=A0ABU9Y0L0_9SPHN